MGLMVHSLALLPSDSKRDYYVYLLDYGWKGSLGEVLFDNFHRLSDYASKNNFVVLRGTPGSHFENEVFSWHGINGEDGEAVLPAILVSTLNPHYFKNSKWDSEYRNESLRERILLIPLKTFCKSINEVTDLIEKVIKDLVEKKSLEDFSILKEIKGGIGRAAMDCLILQPRIAGVGIDVKKLAQFLMK